MCAVKINNSNTATQPQRQDCKYKMRLYWNIFNEIHRLYLGDPSSVCWFVLGKIHRLNENIQFAQVLRKNHKDLMDTS